MILCRQRIIVSNSSVATYCVGESPGPSCWEQNGLLSIGDSGAGKPRVMSQSAHRAIWPRCLHWAAILPGSRWGFPLQRRSSSHCETNSSRVRRELSRRLTWLSSCSDPHENAIVVFAYVQRGKAPILPEHNRSIAVREPLWCLGGLDRRLMELKWFFGANL